MPEISQFAQGYNSFSGVDIKAVFASKVIAELQAISYSITREKAPLYTLGSADPRSFSRGKRGIAGTLIFLVFDRHALLSTFGAYQTDSAQRLNFLSDTDDIRPEAQNTVSASIAGIGVETASGVAVGSGVSTQESNITSVGLVTEGGDQAPAAPWYADQIPPFDITLAAANEHGSLAIMRIYGIEILNEGYGISIDDIVSEQQMTYVARTMVGWRPVGNVSDALAPGAQGQ